MPGEGGLVVHVLALQISVSFSRRARVDSQHHKSEFIRIATAQATRPKAPQKKQAVPTNAIQQGEKKIHLYTFVLYLPEGTLSMVTYRK